MHTPEREWLRHRPGDSPPTYTHQRAMQDEIDNLMADCERAFGPCMLEECVVSGGERQSLGMELGCYEMMQEFVSEVDSGFYPAQDTIRWAAEAFKKFIESGGKRDLKDLLGVNPGPGKVSPFDFGYSQRTEDAKRETSFDIQVLHKAADLSLEKACKAISEKTDLPEYVNVIGNRYDIPPLGPRRLREYYKVHGPSMRTVYVHIKGGSVTSIAVSEDLSEGDFRDRLRETEKMCEGTSTTILHGYSAETLSRLLSTLPPATRSWVESEIKF